jgi:trehalose/maltose transport system permease protein
MSVYARQWLVDYMEVGQGSAASTLLFAFLTISTIIYLIVTRTNFDKQGVY